MNVWIVSLNDKRKHCHNCEAVITGQNRHIGVGEYSRGYYFSAFKVCGKCMIDRINNAVGTKSYTIRVRSGHSRPWFVGSDTRKEA